MPFDLTPSFSASWFSWGSGIFDLIRFYIVVMVFKDSFELPNIDRWPVIRDQDGELLTLGHFSALSPSRSRISS